MLNLQPPAMKLTASDSSDSSDSKTDSTAIRSRSKLKTDSDGTGA